MSQKAVTQIIGRALSDRNFRRLLETNPNKALADFDLTQDEVNLIHSSLQADAPAAADELEPRVSRARLPLDVLSGLMDSFSTHADGIPTSGPTFGTVSFGGKEGVGGLGSGPTGGGTGASLVFPGADTGGGPGDLEHGVVGTGPHEWGSASSETGDSEIPEPDDALNLGPDVGPDLIEGEAGSAPAGGAEIGEVEMPQGVHPGVVDIQGEEGDETGATETGPGMDDGGASEVEGGMGPAQPSAGDMGSGDTGAGGESGVIDIQGEGGGETGATETGAGGMGSGGETGATETGPGMDTGADEAEGGMGPAQPDGAETGGVLDMGGLGSLYGGGSTDAGSEGSDGGDHDDGSSGGGGDSGGSGDTGSSGGGDDDGGDDDGGDEADGGGDDGGSEGGYSVDGGADAGSRPGHGAMPIGAGTARVTGGLSGGGERDDSGQQRVIIESGTGGGESEGDDTGRGGPGIAGAIPTRQVSPELAPLYDPAEHQASVAADSAMKAETGPASGAAASAAGDLRTSEAQGNELADQAETEAKV